MAVRGDYNTRQKSLKQALSLSLSFHNVQPRVFCSTETTVMPKSTSWKGKRGRVSRFLTSIVDLDLCPKPLVILPPPYIAYNTFLSFSTSSERQTKEEKEPPCSTEQRSQEETTGSGDSKSCDKRTCSEEMQNI